MSALVSTFTDIGLINTTTNAGTITLPLTSQIPYRQIIFKDAYGNLANKSLTLSTQTGEVFEDGSTRRVFTNSFGFQTLYGYNGTWYFLGGTSQTSMTLSTLNISTINGGIPTRSIDLISSITGLGSASYISSATLTSSLVSTTLGLQTYISTFIDPTELASTITSTVAGIAITSNLVSTVTGLGSSGYISSLSLVSTTQGLQTYISTFIDPTELASSITSTVAGIAITGNLVSTVTGLGSSGYVSTLSLTSSFQSTTTSFANQLISTTFGTDRQLISTVGGLGNANYISTASLVSTVAGLNRNPVVPPFLSAFTVSTGALIASSINILTANVSTTATISSLIVNSLQFGDGTGWVNLGPIETVALSSIQINTNTLYANNSLFGNTSSATALQYYGLFGNYNNTVLAEVSTGAGFQEFLVFKGSSTSDRVRVQTTGNFVIETGVSARLWNSNTTQTLSNVTPAFIINTSSNVGIQTATPGATLDVNGTARAINLSSQQLFVSSINGDTVVNRSTILSTVTGLGSSGYISSLSLFSTVTGLGSIGYVSSLSLTSTFQSTSAAFGTQLISTTFGLNTQSISTTFGLDRQDISTVTGLGSAGYISSLSLTSTFQSTTTAFGTQLISTTFGLDRQDISTVTGLGSAGYISTLSLRSTVAGLGQLYISSIPSTLSSFQLFTSSLAVSTVFANVLSTQQLFTSSIVGNTSQFIALSSQSLTVSSFYTATRQATPMFVTF